MHLNSKTCLHSKFVLWLQVVSVGCCSQPKQNDTIGISARSLGDIDVSVIMKELGGGGHNSNAATQIKDKTLKEVKQLVIDIVNFKEEDSNN